MFCLRVSGDNFMIKELDLHTKIYRKDNLDLVYLITEKKILNGILHYKLKSERSDEIFLSEFAIKDRFVSNVKEDEIPKIRSVSRLFSKIIERGYKTGRTNDK